jgi:hypothetical protein
MQMGALKLAGGLLVALVVSLPMSANTLPVHMIPDRDGRSHRYTDPDSQQSGNDKNNIIQNSGGDLFRPGRNSLVNLNVTDDDVELPSNEVDVKTANSPAAPDVPTDQVPEPATLLLVAPAALGLLKKFRR